MRLRFDTRDAERAFKALRTRRAPKAIVDALNAGAEAGKDAMTPVISRDIGLPEDQKWIAIHRASSARSESSLHASAKRIPLIRFNAQGPVPSRGKGGGVTANTKTRRYPHAFIATMRSGHRGVFERKTRQTRRLPIRELHGPSIVRVFEAHRAVGVLAAREAIVRTLSAGFRVM